MAALHPKPLLSALGADDLPELARFWRESFPNHPMTEPLLAERVFGPPDAKPANLLAVRSERGALQAIALLAPPAGPNRKTGEMIGGIRWLGVLPAERGRGLGSALLEESCARLESAGAQRIDFLSTPPFYIQPGVDIRETRMIAWLMRNGFKHEDTFFNMSLDLAACALPGPEKIFAPNADGYEVRRATAADRGAFREYCTRAWTPEWAMEAAQGIDHDPVSLFLAERSAATGAAKEIVGFAVYEANQCMGCFGPTGVSEDHQGHGLGRRLLWATLADMKALGRTRCEIGWVGPVDFYYRACGAVLGPVFWAMRKRPAA